MHLDKSMSSQSDTNSVTLTHMLFPRRKSARAAELRKLGTGQTRPAIGTRLGRLPK
jgi:hypothetical protein